MNTIKMLKESDTKFFKEANFADNTFTGEKYFVKVDEESKVVNVSKKEKLKAPASPHKDLVLHNLYDLVEFQGTQKAGIDYKELKMLYLRDVLNKNINLFKNYHISKVSDEDIEKWIKESKEYMESYKVQYKKWEEKKAEFVSSYKEDAKFLISIQDKLDEMIKLGYEIETDLHSKFYFDLLDFIRKEYLIKGEKIYG